jgi:hypothetical protein
MIHMPTKPPPPPPRPPRPPAPPPPFSRLICWCLDVLFATHRVSHACVVWLAVFRYGKRGLASLVPCPPVRLRRHRLHRADRPGRCAGEPAREGAGEGKNGRATARWCPARICAV